MASHSTPSKPKTAWIAPSGSTARLSNTTPKKIVENAASIPSPTSPPKVPSTSSPASKKPKAIWIPPGHSKTVLKSIDWGDKAGHRARLIRIRLSAFESKIAHEKLHSLWPTGKAVSLTQEQIDGKQVQSLWQDVNPSSLELSTLSVPLVDGGKKLEDFTLFGELPVELRLLIWTFAARLPKFIEIRHFTIRYDWPYMKCGNHSNLALVCRESREAAIRVKESDGGAFFRMHRHNKELQTKFTFIPYNPQRDTIFFRPLDIHNVDEQIWSYFSQLRTIQHLAIPLDQDPKLNPLDVLEQVPWRRLLEFCKNVKSITFVLGCGEVSWKSRTTMEARRVENCALEGIHERKGLEWKGKRINVADMRGDSAAWGAWEAGL